MPAVSGGDAVEQQQQLLLLLLVDTIHQVQAIEVDDTGMEAMADIMAGLVRTIEQLQQESFRNDDKMLFLWKWRYHCPKNHHKNHGRNRIPPRRDTMVMTNRTMVVMDPVRWAEVEALVVVVVVAEMDKV